jgi:hypothetical protein
MNERCTVEVSSLGDSARFDFQDENESWTIYLDPNLDGHSYSGSYVEHRNGRALPTPIKPIAREEYETLVERFCLDPNASRVQLGL